MCCATKVKVFVELHAMRQRVRRQGDERAARMAAEAARHVAEQNDRRSNLLAEASRVLGESLDPSVSERRLIELLLPSTACLAVLARTGADESLERVLLGFADQRGDADLHELRGDTLRPALRAVLQRALKHGLRVELDAAALADLRAAAQGVRGAPALHAAAAVPMGSKRRRMGVLLVASEVGPGDRSGYDWTILEELAARAAVAFENAELFRRLQVENAERVAAEAKLQEASRRKDEFLAMLSHELRNPLAPLRNALELMRRVAPQEPRLNWAGEVMDRQLRHMTRLVEELLDVARITEGKIVLSREPVDLRAVMEASVETAQPFIEQHRHKLQVRLPDAPVWMQGDFARLSQVVGNLLHNAAKYSGEGGTIMLELAVENGAATVRVSDNGVGIEPELLPSIFELFTQGQNSLDRGQGGLGVGLTLVRRLVELHGGTVEARSDGPGAGAEFVVRLPAVSLVRGDDHVATAPLAVAAPRAPRADRRRQPRRRRDRRAVPAARRPRGQVRRRRPPGAGLRAGVRSPGRRPRHRPAGTLGVRHGTAHARDARDEGRAADRAHRLRPERRPPPRGAIGLRPPLRQADGSAGAQRSHRPVVGAQVVGPGRRAARARERAALRRLARRRLMPQPPPRNSG